MLILISLFFEDGVHDNFDPVTRGLTPTELGFPEGSTWSTINDTELLQRKSRWMQEEAERLVAALPVCETTGVPAAQTMAHGNLFLKS